MYIERVLEIGKAANGFIVSCNVPLKPDKKKDGKDMISSYPGSCEKKYLAKDTSEVADIIGKLMPMLDMEFKTEDEYDKAFNEAAGTEDED
jgi:hypothetical protein